MSFFIVKIEKDSEKKEAGEEKKYIEMQSRLMISAHDLSGIPHTLRITFIIKNDRYDIVLLGYLIKILELLNKFHH